MGIKNLFYNLPALSVERKLEYFKNKRVGIDANSWLFQAYHAQFNSDFMKNIHGIIRIFDLRIKILQKSQIDVFLLVYLRFRRPKTFVQTRFEPKKR